MESQRPDQPTTWELRLNDGAFTVRADGTSLTVTAGTPDDRDLVLTTEDEHLHRLPTPGHHRQP